MVKVTGLEFKLTKMKAKLICHDCLDIFDDYVFYTSMTQPDSKGAVWEVVNPIADKHAFCKKCMKRRKEI